MLSKEWLGEYYKTCFLEEEHILEFDKEKDIGIPEEYLRNEPRDLPNFNDLKVTIMDVGRGRAEEIANEMLNSSFKLFENERLSLW